MSMSINKKTSNMSILIRTLEKQKNSAIMILSTFLLIIYHAIIATNI